MKALRFSAVFRNVAIEAHELTHRSGREDDRILFDHAFVLANRSRYEARSRSMTSLVGIPILGLAANSS
jgi:hypothetical protein